MTASLRVAAHHRETPSLAEVGGLTTPGAGMPSLTDKPSRIPGRRTASMGCSTAIVRQIRLNMPGRSTPGAPWMISVILQL